MATTSCRVRATVARRSRAPALAATAAAALVACGGGSEIFAIVGFLGTGGGQYFVDGPGAGFDPVDCGGDVCALTLDIDAPPDPDTGVPPPVFFGTRYDVIADAPLPNCNNVRGRVEGRRVTIGSCFTGEYVSVNQLRSDDGRTTLFHDFFPQLPEGVWVDIHDPTRRFKFTGNTAGCEITPSGRRAVAVAITVSNYGIVAFAPGTPLVPATRIGTLAVQGGDTFAGEFIGASGMRLTTPGRSIDLERRNESASCT